MTRHPQIQIVEGKLITIRVVNHIYILAETREQHGEISEKWINQYEKQNFNCHLWKG